MVAFSTELLRGESDHSRLTHVQAGPVPSYGSCSAACIDAGADLTLIDLCPIAFPEPS